MNIYQFGRPLIFQFCPEKSHELAIDFLRFLPHFSTLFSLNKNYENLNQNLFNLDFTSPIGMAAGFDKNAQVISALEKFGFGFIEVGTVTPKAQTGNERPRLFRLKEDEAIINRLGFNNLGSEVFLQNINKIIGKTNIPIGINIGKNKDQENAVLDYLNLLEKFYDKASYITINISSPNTVGLRDLQDQRQLDDFLQEIKNKKNQLQNLHKKNVAILLKLAPDLSIKEQEEISQVVIKNQIDGLIISNTTIDRNLNLKSVYAKENGGLSGTPIFEKSNEVLRNFYKFTERKIPIIGVGGISSASDAYTKIKNGASLVQIYSAFIYKGFGLVERIKKDLSAMVKQDGFKNISDAIGVETR